MTLLRSRAACAAVLLALLVVVVAGCGTGSGAASPRGDAVALTPRALAAVVAEHVGEPNSGMAGEDMEELGRGLAAAVELEYGGHGGDGGNQQLAVGVATGLGRVPGDCWTVEGDDRYVGGCAETEDGMVFWERETPEEDPGVVYVVVRKGRTTVLLFYSGPAITADPRTLELPISVDDMFEIAADPRVDVTTSPETVQAGKDLDWWADG